MEGGFCVDCDVGDDGGDSGEGDVAATRDEMIAFAIMTAIFSARVCVNSDCIVEFNGWMDGFDEVI